MTWSTIFILLFVTVGPVRPTMAFFAMTQSIEPDLRRSIAIRAVSVAALILVVMFFLGASLLNNWQVSLNALLIAGGAILFLSAIQLVLGDEKQNESRPLPAPTLDTAIFPLAAPTIVTPHGLVAIIAIEASMQSVNDHLILLALIMAVMGINLVFLLNANRILAKVPPIVLKIVVRVLGVLLAAMAVQFMIFGFTGLGLIPNV